MDFSLVVNNASLGPAQREFRREDVVDLWTLARMPQVI